MINVSTSGRTWSELERRADCLALDDDLKPDLASLTLSSLNFLTQAFVNAPDTIKALAQIMLERGIVPELEIFDFGMVNYVHVLQKGGLLPGPIVANLFFGNVAGMQATLGEIGLAIDRLPSEPSGREPASATSSSPPSRSRSRRAAASASGWRTASSRPRPDRAGDQPDAGRAGPCAARAARPQGDDPDELRGSAGSAA